MKLIISLFALLWLFSCSTDTENGAETTPYAASDPALAKPMRAVGNTAKPYDVAGITYAAIQDNLIDHPGALSQADVLNSCLANIAFQEMQAQEYVPVPENVLEGVFNGAEADFSQFVSGTDLSGEAKSQLLLLADSLLSLKLKDADYDAVSHFIADFESSIGASPVPEDDKAVLLVTASILKHGYYNESKRRRRDRDWELSIGHIAATAFGAGLSNANAISASLGSRYALMD